MKNLETRIPQIILGVYAILYITGIARSFAEGEISFYHYCHFKFRQ